MDRLFKKTIAVFILAALFFASLCTAAFAIQEIDVSIATISKSSAELKTGQSVKLTVKKPEVKVKWKSSDESIAYVKLVKGKKKQIAVIKAGKKTGTCRITAQVGKTKLTCRVVRLSASTKDLSAKVKAGKAEKLGASGKFKKSAADFSFELLRKTIETDAEKGKSVNTLISPDSILSALVMTENGAKGSTLSEMQDVLSGGISAADYNKYLYGMNRRLNSSKLVKYNVANSIWSRKGEIKVKKSFLKTNKTYHNAQLFEAAFNSKTVQDMNNWVAVHTNGMIKNIIDRLDKDHQIVLINAIAFEGKWEEKFSDPVKKKFTPESGNAKKVNTLCKTETLEYISVNGGKGFVKDYMGGEIAFVGLLPPEGVSVDEYLNGLTGKKFISAWKSKEYKRLDINLPEFKYDYGASMKDPLKKMGMVRAFSSSANFKGMFTPTETMPNINIDDVIHKTHIEVDKNGTKAAAATEVGMGKSTAYHDEEKPIEVHLNRPFIYALVDTKTGIPLFTGVYRGL